MNEHLPLRNETKIAIFCPRARRAIIPRLIGHLSGHGYTVHRRDVDFWPASTIPGDMYPDDNKTTRYCLLSLRDHDYPIQIYYRPEESELAIHVATPHALHAVAASIAAVNGW